MKRLRASHEVFMAVWRGRPCLGYDAISRGYHFPVFQRSIAFIQGLEVQGQKRKDIGTVSAVDG